MTLQKLILRVKKDVAENKTTTAIVPIFERPPWRKSGPTGYRAQSSGSEDELAINCTNLTPGMIHHFITHVPYLPDGLWREFWTDDTAESDSTRDMSCRVMPPTEDRPHRDTFLVKPPQNTQESRKAEFCPKSLIKSKSSRQKWVLNELQTATVEIFAHGKTLSPKAKRPEHTGLSGNEKTRKRKGSPEAMKTGSRQHLPTSPFVAFDSNPAHNY
ncbi:hypothetical protein T265_02974 [Opisthorchis viverrini]|uniref:Uncharacterized protein n=1 Tax=Opisthorchis viverrini TaxID=6198 RepID=A0A074ZXG9_OPIVI|nr:hypothetical protein T265_02974 [Opisthorchis viverrini]KER30622.1 hypothetical protein T265_02974 [Opisthorchis viverrini]